MDRFNPLDPQELAARHTPIQHLQKILNEVRVGRDCGTVLTLENFNQCNLERQASLGTISQLSRVAYWLRPTLQPLFPEIDWNGIVRMRRLSAPIYYRVRRWWTLNTLQNFLPRIEAQLEQALAAASNVAPANG